MLDEDLLSATEVADLAKCRCAWVTYWAEKGVLRYKWGYRSQGRQRLFSVRWARAFKMDHRRGHLWRGSCSEIRHRQKIIAGLFATAGPEAGEELLRRWIAKKWIVPGPVFMPALAQREDAGKRVRQPGVRRKMNLPEAQN